MRKLFFLPLCIWLFSFNISQAATLNLKLFIGGFYLGGGLMKPVLYNCGYSTDPTATDTITVNLWAPANLGNAIPDYSAKAILHSNGSSTITYPASVVGNSFYISVKHRNSIQTWSASAVLFAATTNYDFTTAASKAYGGNMKNLGSGVFGFYQGDINQDCNVDLIDFPPMDFGINHSMFGYPTADLNGDCNVDLLDFPILDASIKAGILCQP